MKEIYPKLPTDKAIEIKKKVKGIVTELNIEYWRSQKGFSQKQFSDLLDIKQSYLSLLENNKVMPSVEILTKMAFILDIEPGLLVNAYDSSKRKIKRRMVEVDDNIALLLTEMKKLPQGVQEALSKSYLQTFRQLSDAYSIKKRKTGDNNI